MNRTAKRLLPTGQPHERRHPLEDGGVMITNFVPLQFSRRGIKKVVVSMSAAAITPSQDPTLLKALARGVYWQHLLDRYQRGGGCRRDCRAGEHSSGNVQR